MKLEDIKINPEIKRIALWSGPRNISTALMYSFAQRADTRVYDEPLYGFYLKETAAQEYHPAAEETINSMECNGEQVIKNMLTDESKPVLFFKNMTHHLLDLDTAFLKHTVNVILTRNPKEMIHSFAKVIPNPSLLDLGFEQHAQLVKKLRAFGQEPIIIEGKDILKDPLQGLSQLCDQIGISFDEAMLSWEAGSRPEDGVWAKHWYGNVHSSTGFQPYIEKEVDIPEHLKALEQQCQKLYQEVKERPASIKPTF